MRLPAPSQLAPLGTGQGRLSALRLPLLTSLANQALSSGGNFLLGIYLARTMTLEHFGLYGIFYGLCMLYVGIGNALILTQMSVTLPTRAQEEREAYAARMLFAVVLLGAALQALALAIPAALAWLPQPERALLQPLPIVATAAALFLGAEFFIAYAYLRRRESLALAVNGAIMLVLGAGLLACHLARRPLTPGTVLGLYALGAAAGCCTGYAAAPLAWRHNGAVLGAEYRASWRHGRWALGGVGVTWVQAQAYAYTLAVLLGPAGVGLANLARIFISPFSFLLPAVNKLAIPRLSELRLADPARMRRLSVMLTIALSSLALLYAVLLLSAFGFLSHLLLGREVAGLAPLVTLWCLVLLFQVLRSGGAVLLQLQQRFKALTLMSLPSAAVTMAASILLAQTSGPAGALAGLLAGECTLTALIWREIRHAASHRQQ